MRLFCNRVLISDADRSLLGSELLAFLGGVLDVEDLPVVISRNGIIEDSDQATEVRRGMVAHLAQALDDLARTKSADFRRIVSGYGSAVKSAAIKEPVLLSRLRDHFPYRSNMNRTVTIPQYLSQRDDHTVVFADDHSLDDSLMPLYNRANVEVIYMTDMVDRSLRDDWVYDGVRVIFRRLDVDPPLGGQSPLQASDEAQPLEPSVLEALRQLFRSAVDTSLGIEVRRLGQNGPPALLALSEENREKMQFVHAVREHRKDGRFSELPKDVQEMARSGFLDALDTTDGQRLILNHSNAIVVQLLALFQGHFSVQSQPVAVPANLEIMLARFLHGQALLSSGLRLSSEKLTEISQGQSRLISALLKQLNRSQSL